ncbi:Endoribonuclease Dcr-1 [Papilio machaon]|uniref:Endoribonuclease Dcr-1 n=1 Tax=Papilio machaon TaxID=76193 RepID=A0A0N1IJH5_PAPMA|nr:Endoribonuclease Dcr-1 [Papilio machaon]
MSHASSTNSLQLQYDPSEIYGDDLYEEFINIPDPTKEPKEIFAQFLYILNELGPYAADKAAFSLLAKLEKLKIKVPYERHFLLLCMCTTILIKIRGYADYVFSKYTSDWEKIKLFCTPKVLRLAEILEQFRPQESEKIDANSDSPTNETICTISETNCTLNETGDIRNETDCKNEINTTTNETDHKINETIRKTNENDNKNEMNTSKTKQMLNIIENCDFTTLGNKIEDRVNTYEANLKEIDVYSVSDKKTSDKSDTKVIKVEEYKSVRGRQRVRGRPRVLKNNTVRIQQNQNPDALCGIMFLREPLMAKILFMLIVDISRCRPSLSYICAQYCAVEVAGELQECQRQSRKQEDVLKKFRMHECNLLLATPTLEEGIDLPRCNLVLRWDVPPSYRSHALCRGRARAPRSSLALLAEAPQHSEMLLHHLAIYKELDEIVTRKCGCGIQDEPTSEEESYADDLTAIVKAYTPMETKMTQMNTETVISPKNKIDEENKEIRQSIEDKKENLEESRNERSNNTDSDKDIAKNEIELDRNETESDRNNEINMKEVSTTEVKQNFGNKISVNTNNDKSDSDYKNIAVDSEVNERTIKKSDSDSIASVDLSTAIALINR